MTISAKSVIQRAVETSNDPTSIRWPVNELVRYLNDGMREIALHRPDAFNTSADITCIAGTKQSLPTGGIKLIAVPKNNSITKKRAITLCERRVLDRTVPDWHSKTQVEEIIHYMFDPVEPRVFWVYPPALTSSVVTVNYCASPSEVNETTTYTTFTELPSADLAIQAIYANALCDYILYRQYLKDADFAGNSQRSNNHMASFANSLGIELKATMNLAEVTSNGAEPRQAKV